jgi:hypothetical protein
MLQLANQTPFECALGILPNLDGVECAVAVVKATFEFAGGQLALARRQRRPYMMDEFHGEPGASSLKVAAEICLPKPGTDVLLVGHAYARDDATFTDVHLRVGGMEKVVRVFGDRRWDSGLLGYKISPPEPFQKIPLQYELAFGGTDAQPKDESKVDYEPRNPVGRGLIPKGSQTPVKGTPLPNLEDPASLIRSIKDRPAPACFAPVAPHWTPRKHLAGTYDAEWQRTRAPYLPKDFQPRFFQCAPPGLIAEPFLRGGESVAISGASAAGTSRFALPNCTLQVAFNLDGKVNAVAPSLDTVEFTPDSSSFTLLWRALQVLDKKTLRLREIGVSCREFRKAGC